LKGLLFVHVKSLICATVIADSISALREARDAVSRQADLVELRLDALREVDVAAALAGRTGPVLVACHPAWEGGRFAGSEEERCRILADALRLGADYVDIEWRAAFDDLIRARNGRGIVLSLHAFDGIPADLAGKIRAMRATGAETVKVAATARSLRDALVIGNAFRDDDGPHIAIAMGTPGVCTRILAARFGSRWMYAGDLVAPGQVPLAELVGDYRFGSLTDRTAIYGVVGRPIGHSVSPAMHNAAFAALGIDACYLPLEAADADDFVDFARAMGVRGVSVTAPFKRDLMERIDVVDPVAAQVGAINTIRMDEGRWAATNTDVGGFLAPLLTRTLIDGTRASVLGAGGAARGVAIALAHSGAKVTICARDVSRAEKVAALVGGQAASLPPAPGSWDLLVNATPVGTWPEVDASPMAGAPLDGRIVYDLVYNPIRTRLLEDAERAGCETIGGLDMLVAQAQRQCEWWTGRRVATAVMRDAARRRLAATGAGHGFSHAARSAAR
jgi:3-dehydroquinate dehydratase/shikimate dehydrogenase